MLNINNTERLWRSEGVNGELSPEASVSDNNLAD